MDLILKDMQLFVLYDFASSQYAVFGHRKPNKGTSKETKKLYAPFYFMAKTAKDVANFISTVVEKNNYFTFALYSFNTLPSTVEEMSFNLLYKYLKNTRELSAFDDMEFSHDKVRDMVSLTRTVYSMYEFPEYNEYAEEEI